MANMKYLCRSLSVAAVLTQHVAVGERALGARGGGGGGRRGQDVRLALHGRRALRAQRAEGRARRQPALLALVQLHARWNTGPLVNNDKCTGCTPRNSLVVLGMERALIACLHYK